jgi:hypothetical protein
MAKGILIAAMDFWPVARTNSTIDPTWSACLSSLRIPDCLNAERWIDVKKPKGRVRDL